MWDKFKEMAGGGFGKVATDMLVNRVVDFVKEKFGDNIPDVVSELEEHVKVGNAAEVGNKLISLLTSGGDKPDWLDLVQKLKDEDKLKVASEILKKLKG